LIIKKNFFIVIFINFVNSLEKQSFKVKNKEKNIIPGSIETEQIDVFGARVHNLKNIDVSIPRNKITVITGLSGSGKSSLAFDTIFAEGQRRYIETFSAYARNFLGNMERPDVDKITGLSPVISIEQKTTNKNPRSTVGTITEIYDFFRLLFARAGEAYSYVTGEKMVKYTEEQILGLILSEYVDEAVFILAPLVRARKGHYKELFEQVRKKGYLYVRVDGEIREIIHGMKLDRYKNHNVEVVIDKLVVTQKNLQRVKQSVQTAMKQGSGSIMIVRKSDESVRHFSKLLMCPVSGISYSEAAPHNFSFNSPHGACPVCKGLGFINEIDLDKIIPDKQQSIYDGGIIPLGKYRKTLFFWQLEAIAEKYGFKLKTPIKDIPDEVLDIILNGSEEKINVKNLSLGTNNYSLSFEGVLHYVEMQQESEASATAQKWASQFSKTGACPECHGARLKKEAIHYRIADKNIAQLAEMDLTELNEWINSLDEKLSERQKKIAPEILKEIRTRIRFLLDVGLDYLSLNRSSMTLSGGESQRIRLATQIGTQLVNVLYILDEPSIGLHQRDNMRLINSLKQLRDIGNSVIVVEHDKDMMMHSDYVIDLGPRAGRHGGEVVFTGTPDQIFTAQTLTANYLNGERQIEVPVEKRPGNGHEIVIKGARGNNLKKVDVSFPLGKFICVTGVSGSGKSSLVHDTLQPILSQHFYRSLQDPLPYDSVEGIQHVDKVINVDQSPIGRTPRSNPSTYTGLFSDIRNLFVSLPESKMRGYKPGRFSFNVKGGRCETCSGNGYKTIEMNFLPDVYVPCEECHGKRYNRETLEVRYKGRSIADVLDMTINQAVEFFENIPSISLKVKTLQSIGLGYIKLGQPSTTLSGGESQRIKLATELMRKDTGNTLYILDEPTTGLHFEDIRILLDVLNKLADKGNTILVIEHNLDVIKVADYIIDMGPEGGREGGRIIGCGTPEEIARIKGSYTGSFLKEELKNS
jgi:excinuclease ABC subunit A